MYNNGTYIRLLLCNGVEEITAEEVEANAAEAPRPFGAQVGSAPYTGGSQSHGKDSSKSPPSTFSGLRVRRCPIRGCYLYNEHISSVML
eukprot:4873828-Pyramimonas_sp.AAC.1